MVVRIEDHVVERHLSSTASGNQNLAELLRTGAEVARIPDPHRKPLPALDGGGQVLAADGRIDHVFYVADIQAVATGGGAVDRHLEIRRARGALRVDIRRAGNLPDNILDLIGLGLDDAQIGAEHLDADLGANAGGEHVDAVADGLRPDVGHAGNLQLFVEPRHDRVLGQALGPRVLGLEDDRGLFHVHRRWIGRGLRAAHFAHHHVDLRIGGDDAVLLAHDLGGAGQRDARVSDGHEQGGFFIERRHELRPDGGADIDGRAEQQHRRGQSEEAVAQGPAQHWLIDRAAARASRGSDLRDGACRESEMCTGREPV